MEITVDIGVSAIAVADLKGVYALPKVYWKIKNFPQCKLICAVDLRIDNHANLTLLVQDREADKAQAGTFTILVLRSTPHS